MCACASAPSSPRHSRARRPRLRRAWMRCSAPPEADHCTFTVHGPKFAARDTERVAAVTCKCAKWHWFGLVELGGIEPPTLRLPGASGPFPGTSQGVHKRPPIAGLRRLLPSTHVPRNPRISTPAATLGLHHRSVLSGPFLATLRVSGCEPQPATSRAPLYGRPPCGRSGTRARSHSRATSSPRKP